MKQVIVLISFFFSSMISFAQSSSDKVKIFMDCKNEWLCDQDFLRSELKMVDFVRDRFACDIQIVQTTQFTGGGGENTILSFQGQKSFSNTNDTLTYFNTAVATEDMKRKKMVQFIKLGLIQYLSKTPWAEAMSITYTSGDSTVSAKQKDPFNLWQFSIGASGFFNGDKNNASNSFNMNIRASRETTEERFFFFATNSIDRDKYVYFSKTAQGKDTSQTYIAKRDAQNASVEYVKKPNEHWAYGVNIFGSRSVFDNLDFRVSVKPKIEYSLLPYKDFNSQSVIINYRIGPEFSNYADTTIYLKTKELLVQQALNINTSFTKNWGSINLGVGFEHYLSDFNKNNLFLGGGIEWNIFKGFRFGMGGNFQFIHDQISIPKANASLEEVLIQSRIIATDYDYFFGIGCSYTFGSIYNSQVNPTFKGLNYNLSF
jgi:hypothetical protein